MKSLILVYFTLIFLTACTTNTSKQDIIEPDKMVEVLTDIHIVDGYISTFRQSDTLKQRASSYYAAVYKHHHIDSLTYKNSLEYYSRNPKLLDTIYYKVNNQLEDLRKFESDRADKKRLDEDKYQNLKRETKGTLFKPYDIWFFRFTMPDSFYPNKKVAGSNTQPSANQDSVKVSIANAKAKAMADSMAVIKQQRHQRRMRIPERNN
ncbi:MAG: hypothetical protein JWN56_2860 [Sphingobacteriales bacterium]|nr:hypothetical protein [Sphingobacteriales bacterium]